MKHLEKFRARLVNGDDDDFVVRHRANDLDDVLGIFRAQPRGRLVEKINVRRTDHVEADVEPLSLAAAQRFLDRGCPTTASRRSLKPSSTNLRFQAARVGRAVTRCGERIAAANCRFSPMVRCSSNASSCGM